MLCSNCKKNQANTTITNNINGHVTVRHLCAECAAKAGITTAGSILGVMLGGMFNRPAAVEQERKCAICGSTFADFARTGKAGCPNCYTEFYAELIPTLQRIHGKTFHVGKKPDAEPNSDGGEAHGKPEPTVEDRISDLKKRLEEAVSKQEFEDAARLRDEIKAIEG